MSLAYQINLFLHALAGLVTLVVLPLPLLAKKGRRLHRLAGWAFTSALTFVSLTGLGLALAWLAVPLQVKPPSAEIGPEQLAALIRNYRLFGVFFLTIAIMSASSVWYGITAVPLAQAGRRGRLVHLLDHLVVGLMLVSGLALLGVGLRTLQPLLLGFGVLAFVSGLADLRFVRRPPSERKAWLVRHLQAMLGGATTAITAFSALTLRRYVPGATGFELGYWLIPVALGIVAIIAWTRRVRATMDRQ